jgi:co-chaperonin GroES (HSP10)
MSTLTPLPDRIIVRRMKYATSTESGLAIVRRKEEENDIGEVVAAGQNDSGVVAGDTIVFEGARAQPLEWDGERLYRLHIEDLHAVVPQ